MLLKLFLGLMLLGVSGGREGWAGSARRRRQRLLLLARAPAGAWQAASGSARSG